MLAVIESLQRQAEENSEELSDKNDENLHDPTEVSKPSDSTDKVLEEIKDNELNQPHKRRKEWRPGYFGPLDYGFSLNSKGRTADAIFKCYRLLDIDLYMVFWYIFSLSWCVMIGVEVHVIENLNCNAYLNALCVFIEDVMLTTNSIKQVWIFNVDFRCKVI